MKINKGRLSLVVMSTEMSNTTISCKLKSMRMIAFLLLIFSIFNINSEEIQPFPQLKEFPKLPQIPKIEPIRVPEPIKPFKTMPAEVDRSKLISVQSLIFEKSQLIGDWKSSQPFKAKYIGGVTNIEGIMFTVLPDSSITKEWTSEGVMYESTTKDGARRFVSSFNYKILNNIVLLMITYSSNELKNGVVIPFEIIEVSINSGMGRVLKLKNDNSIIELIEDKSTEKLNFTTENKADARVIANEREMQNNVNLAPEVSNNKSSSVEERIRQRRLELESSQNWVGKAKNKDELLSQAKIDKAVQGKSCGSNVPRLSSENLAIQEVTTEDLKQKILDAHQNFLQRKVNQPKSAERFNYLKKEVELARGFYNANISNHCAVGLRMIEGLSGAENETKLLINLMNNFVADLNK